MAELAVILSARNNGAQAAIDGLHNQLSGVQKQVAGLKQSLAQAGQGLQSFGAKMSLGVTTPLVGIGVAAVAAASDLNESLSKVGVVFDENAASIEAWSKTAATSFGLSQQQALEAAGTFGNLFVALGMGDQATSEMSTGLVQLAADLASFNNIDPTEALEKLRAGIVGETEPLRTLGVNLTAAAVEAKALSMGLAATGKELTEQDKVTARYALIMEQTATAQGDFARTADGLANSQRILKAELADAAANLGTLLLPYALQAVDAISQLVTWFGSLSPAMQQFAVIGAVAAAAIGPLAAVLGTVLTVLSALISPIGLVVAGVGLLAAAWAMNLGGIQEFTNSLTAGLQPAFEAISSGAVSLEGVLGELGATLLGIGTDTYDTTDNIRDLTLALTGSQDAANAVESGLRTAGETIQAFGQQVADIFAQIGAFLAPALANVQSAFGDMMTGLGELGPEVGALGEAFGNLLAALEPVATFIGAVLVVAFDTLLNLLAEIMRAIPELLRNAITIVTDLINLMAANITNTVALIKAVITGDWDEAWRLAGQIVTDNAGFITRTFQTLLDSVTTIANAVLEAVKKSFGDVATFLAGLGLDNPFEGFAGPINAVIEVIGSVQSKLQEFQGWLSGFSLPEINWPSVPQGLTDALNSLNPFGGNGAIGRINFQGGAMMVGEAGPELVMLPRGSRIYGAQETERMAAGGAGVAVTVQNMVVRDDRDIYSLAYQVADILSRA